MDRRAETILGLIPQRPDDAPPHAHDDWSEGVPAFRAVPFKEAESALINSLGSESARRYAVAWAEQNGDKLAELLKGLGKDDLNHDVLALGHWFGDISQIEGACNGVTISGQFSITCGTAPGKGRTTARTPSASPPSSPCLKGLSRWRSCLWKIGPLAAMRAHHYNFEVPSVAARRGPAPQRRRTAMSMSKRLAIGVLASGVLLAQPALAADCGGDNIAASILKNHQDKLKNLGCKGDEDCIKDRAKKEALIKEGIRFWNSMVGNSWAAIGPRELEIAKELKGTVVNPGERKFITALPIIDFDNLDLAINKQGGKAETSIQISKLDARGSCSVVATETVAAGDGSYRKTVNLTAVRGSVLIVRLTPKGLGRKLEYTLNATGR